MFCFNLKKKSFLIILSILLLANFIVINIDNANAQLKDPTYGLKTTAEKAFGSNITSSPSAQEAIGQIIGIILSFLGIIFFVLVIYGGFLWMTAAGSEEQVGKAKKIIVYAAIGIIIILSAYVITNFITTEFTDIVTPEAP